MGDLKGGGVGDIAGCCLRIIMSVEFLFLVN
jgi:hypothetical protein